MSEGHAAVVEEVDELDREDRAKEGRMGQWGRAQGLGKAAEVRAEETEPLCKNIWLAAVPYNHEMDSGQGEREQLTPTRRVGRVAAMTSTKKIEKIL